MTYVIMTEEQRRHSTEHNETPTNHWGQLREFNSLQEAQLFLSNYASELYPGHIYQRNGQEFTQQ